ncbi:MAG: pentapeptide repeat-containing protein [Deltaproteobacteria bacterium]|nr:pentapeptide repeat-containing protein [Deltaproteobacteria bacterium]
MADEIALNLLIDDKFIELNNLIDSRGGEVDLSNANIRARDLRGCHFKKANLRNTYLRLSDLRGLDLSQADLEGASMRDAKVSGVYFPKNIDPQEIYLSLRFGTRMRIRA